LWRWAGSSGPLGDVGRFFVCQDVGHCLLGVGCCRGLFAWDAWHFLLASIMNAHIVWQLKKGPQWWLSGCFIDSQVRQQVWSLATWFVTWSGKFGV
jgi:hypothetical protein